MKLMVICLVSALLTSYAEFSILSAQSRVDRARSWSGQPLPDPGLWTTQLGCR